MNMVRMHYILLGIILITVLGVHNVTAAQKCSGNMKSVFITSTKRDFLVVIKEIFDPTKNKTVNLKNLVAGQNGHVVVQTLQLLEITGSKFTGEFKVVDFTFDAIVQNPPATIRVDFLNKQNIALSKRHEEQILKDKTTKIVFAVPFIDRLPLLDSIQISSISTSFEVGGMFLQACAKNGRKATRKPGTKTAIQPTKPFKKKKTPKPSKKPTIRITKPFRTTTTPKPSKKPTIRITKPFRTTTLKTSKTSVMKPWKKAGYILGSECCPPPINDPTTSTPHVSFDDTGIHFPGPVTPANWTRLVFVVEAGVYSNANIKVTAQTLQQMADKLMKKDFKHYKAALVTFSSKGKLWFDRGTPKQLFTSLIAASKQPKPKFPGADYTSILPIMQNILCEKGIGNKDWAENIVLLITSTSHNGCHIALIQMGKFLYMNAKVLVMGIGPASNKNELTMLVNDDSNLHMLPSFNKNLAIKAIAEVVSENYTLIQCEAFVGNPKSIPNVARDSGSNCVSRHRLVPDIIKKIGFTSLWDEIIDFYLSAVNTCMYANELEQEIRTEMGEQVEFPDSKMVKYYKALEKFSKYVLEGKFKLQDNNIKAIQTWMSTSLVKHYSQMQKEVNILFKELPRAGDGYKHGCIESLLNNSLLKQQMVNLKQHLGILNTEFKSIKKVQPNS